MCHPPTPPGCLPSRGTSVDNTCTPKDKHLPLHPFPLPNVCAVFLILLSYTLTYMYYVCAYTHTYTYTYRATQYKWVVLCGWTPPQSSRCVNPPVGVCFSARPLKGHNAPEPGMYLRLDEHSAPLYFLPRMSTLCLCFSCNSF